eukprot:SAG22_NODE_3321_length_1780_cov_2.068412_1_plen_241_part_00
MWWVRIVSQPEPLPEGGEDRRGALQPAVSTILELLRYCRRAVEAVGKQKPTALPGGRTGEPGRRAGPAAAPRSMAGRTVQSASIRPAAASKQARNKPQGTNGSETRGKGRAGSVKERQVLPHQVQVVASVDVQLGHRCVGHRSRRTAARSRWWYPEPKVDLLQLRRQRGWQRRQPDLRWPAHQLIATVLCKRSGTARKGRERQGKAVKREDRCLTAPSGAFTRGPPPAGAAAPPAGSRFR